MAQREADLLTQAEYARHRKAAGLPGGSREAVSKAVEEGRIGTIAGKIHAAIADEEWARNTRARFSPQAAAKAPAAAAGDTDQDLVHQAQNAGSSSAPPVPSQPPAPDTGYTAARARREMAEAEQAEIDLKKAKGQLVAWEDVQRGGFEVARELRDTMESAVNALAAEMASLPNAEACAEVIRRHNRAVCDVLVKGWREKIGPLPAGGLA